jgi:DNA repair exonuclease SbcCD nuclease subunit
VAGDLFATGVASRRTVERAAAEIARLVAARIRTVILPGDLDPDDRASVYRAYDLRALAGSREEDDLVTVLDVDRPAVHLASLDAVVTGVPGRGDGAVPSLSGLSASVADLPAAAWRLGVAHAAPDVIGGELPVAEIAAAGVDYLALGKAAVRATGREGDVSWGVPGSPEQVVVERPEPGSVLLVTLDLKGDARSVTTDARTTGRTTYRDEVLDVASVRSQEALVAQLRRSADPDQVLEVRLAGRLVDELVIDPAAVEDALKGDYLRIRVRDTSQPELTTGELPPSDTVAGAFIRSVEGRIADLAASGEPDADEEAAELREVLRLGRRLLAGAEVVA